jgi:hypothetical protein
MMMETNIEAEKLEKLCFLFVELQWILNGLIPQNTCPVLVGLIPKKEQGLTEPQYPRI